MVVSLVVSQCCFILCNKNKNHKENINGKNFSIYSTSIFQEFQQIKLKKPVAVLLFCVLSFIYIFNYNENNVPPVQLRKTLLSHKGILAVVLYVYIFNYIKNLRVLKRINQYNTFFKK